MKALPQNKNFTHRWCLLAIAMAALSVASAPSLSASSYLSMGLLDYAVVGVGGDVTIDSDFEVYQSDTVIYGNVAQGPNSNLSHGIDSTVYGRWDYDLTDSNPAAAGYTGYVSGGFHQKDLSGLATDARNASATLAALSPTQVFTSLQNGQTIIGNSALNVIKITGTSAIKTFLTLQGTASSVFVFNFTSTNKNPLTLSGMTMNLIGGIQPGNIYWNFKGKGGDVTINAMAPGQTVYGNFLAPDRNLTADHAIVLGRLIAGGGGSSLSIHSSSKITTPPPVSP
jgi:choice-of-anchor A domain-containing protein